MLTSSGKPYSPFDIHVETGYAIRLTRLLRLLQEDAARLTLPRLEDIIREAIVSGVRQDAMPTLKAIREALKSAHSGSNAKLEAVLRTAGEEARNEVLRAQRKILAGAESQVAGPSIPGFDDLLEDWKEVNALRVEAIVDQYTSDLWGASRELVKSGASATEIAKELRAGYFAKDAPRFAKARKRAQAVARDQAASFMGDLAEARQKSQGIKQYIWRTVQDERVRHSHAEREGVVFDWGPIIPQLLAKGLTVDPYEGHPGKPYNCRCYPEPIIPEFDELSELESLPDPEPEPAPPPPPAPAIELEPEPEPAPPPAPEPAPPPAPEPAPAFESAVERYREKSLPTLPGAPWIDENTGYALKDAKVHEATEQKLGRRLTKEQLRDLAGIPKDAVTTIDTDYHTNSIKVNATYVHPPFEESGFKFTPESQGEFESWVRVQSPGRDFRLVPDGRRYRASTILSGDEPTPEEVAELEAIIREKGLMTLEMERTIYGTDEGVGVTNDLFAAYPTGTGFGVEALSSQMDAAAKAGVSAISTAAGRGPGENGYYTWPRLGYDGPLNKSLREEYGVDTVQELLALDGGKDIWRERGHTVLLEFDPREGSVSRKRLERYLERRAGKAEATKAAEEEAARRAAEEEAARKAAEEAARKAAEEAARKAAEEAERKAAEEEEAIDEILGRTEATKKPIKEIANMTDAEIKEEVERLVALNYIEKTGKITPKQQFERILNQEDWDGPRTESTTVAGAISNFISGNTYMADRFPKVFEPLTSMKLKNPGQLSRGMVFSMRKISKIKPGDTLDLGSYSSWSYSDRIAQEFSTGMGSAENAGEVGADSQPLVVRIKHAKVGGDISEISQLNEEEEVIKSGRIRFVSEPQIEDIKRYGHVNKVWVVYAEEIDEAAEARKAAEESARKAAEEAARKPRYAPIIQAIQDKGVPGDGFALPEDMEKLNDEEKEVFESVGFFTGGSVAVVKDPSRWDPSRPRYAPDGMEHIARVEQHHYVTANKVMKAMASDPSNDLPSIYRGMRLNERFLNELDEGSVFDAGEIASFSKDRDKAIGFALSPSGDKERSAGNRIPVLFEVAKPKAGTDISEISVFTHEQEFVSGGKFRVVSKEGANLSDPTALVPSGSMDGFIVKLEQIPPKQKKDSAEDPSVSISEEAQAEIQRGFERKNERDRPDERPAE